MKLSTIFAVSALVAGTSAAPTKGPALEDSPRAAGTTGSPIFSPSSLHSHIQGYTRPNLGPNPYPHSHSVSNPKSKTSFFPASIGALLSYLGVAQSSPDSHSHLHTHAHNQALHPLSHAHLTGVAVVPDFFPAAPPPSAGPAALASWQHKLEDYIHTSEQRMGRPVYIEGGVGKLSVEPFTGERDSWLPSLDGERKHGLHSAHHAHTQEEHAHAHSQAHNAYHQMACFSARLHRALHQLTHAEALVLAFVLGAGLGSLIHLIFMLGLLSLRAFRSKRAERRARREARRDAHREARRARKAALRALARGNGGVVRLEGEDVMVVEALPVYNEAEAVVVDEKV